MRKKLNIFIILFLAITTLATNSYAKDANKEPHKEIIVYYFHTTNRCYSCKIIENWTYDTIQTYFKDELKNKTLKWKPLNVEDESNRHFIKDYKLYSKSIVVSEMDKEKEIRWKNLDKVWQSLRDKEKFSNYIRNEIKSYLEN